VSGPDFAARGLAAQVGRRMRRQRVVDRLARGVARGGLPGLAANPPVIAASSASSALSGTLVTPVTSLQSFTFLRAAWALAGSGYPLNGFFAPFVVTDPVGGNNGGCTPLIRFHTSAADFELYLLDKAGTSGQYRLKADGQYLATGRIGPAKADGSLNWQRVTWGDGSAANRKPRLYEIEAGPLFRFGGVKLGQADSLWPAPVADGLTLLVHGDSFVEGTGASGTALPPPFAAQVGLLLGQPNTVTSGLGGTGFLNTSNGQRATFIQRLATDVLPFAPEVVVEVGGINDDGLVGATPAPVQAAVTAWLAALTAALPDVLVVMTGPMSPGSAGNAGSNGLVRDAKKAAAAAFPNNVLFLDNLAEGWVTGTGRSGATKGDGNADWVTGGIDGTDATHPTDLGHAYLARRLASGIAGLLGTGLLA
jgi:lysophospholipase L1-like esterase